MKYRWHASTVAALLVSITITGEKTPTFRQGSVTASGITVPIDWGVVRSVLTELRGKSTEDTLCANCDSITMNTDPQTHGTYPYKIWWGECSGQSAARLTPGPLARAEGGDQDSLSSWPADLQPGGRHLPRM